MKKSKRLDILEKAVSELALDLGKLTKDYKEFIEIDREWSGKVSRKLCSLSEELSLTRCVLVNVAMEANIPAKRMKEILQESVTLHEVANTVPDEVLDMPAEEAKKAVENIISNMIRGGASEH